MCLTCAAASPPVVASNKPRSERCVAAGARTPQTSVVHVSAWLHREVFGNIQGKVRNGKREDHINYCKDRLLLNTFCSHKVLWTRKAALLFGCSEMEVHTFLHFFDGGRDSSKYSILLYLIEFEFYLLFSGYI